MPSPDLNALAVAYRVPATMTRLSDDAMIVQGAPGGRWLVKAATLPGPRFLSTDGKWHVGGSPESFTSPDAALAAVLAAPAIPHRRRARVARGFDG